MKGLQELGALTHRVRTSARFQYFANPYVHF